MTTPSTNLSLLDIQNEFGGTNPISLNEYYRGGSYVNINQGNSGYGLIPTSGTIDIGVFRNQSVYVPTQNDVGSFLGTTFSQSWTEDISSGRGQPNYVTYSRGGQGYPLTCNQYTWDETCTLGGNRSGSVTNLSASGRDVRGRPSPTFTISNIKSRTATYRIECIWIIHSHTLINHMLYLSNNTLLQQSGYLDYNFNPAAGQNYSNPGGKTYTFNVNVNIAANSSITCYVKNDSYWNGDYDYASHWWSGISRINAYFVAYV